MSYRWRKPAELLIAPRPQHAGLSLLTISRPATVGVGVVALAAAALVGLVTTHGGASAADDGTGRPAARPAALGAALSSSVMELATSPQTSAAAFALAGTTAAHPAGPVSRTAGPTQTPDTTPASELAASGLPATALAAYERAADREKSINPGCRLTWPLLAGIGRIESNHGRFAGAVLHSDGLSTPQIVGIPLDGHGTALIRDTDHGRLDGDRIYDRAVGPMQFIPSTWASWGVDADHDGTANPFDIADAAAAAADYLCAAGQNLSTYAGQVRAVLSYNHSMAYVASVLGVERIYAGAGGVRVPVIPTHPDPGIAKQTGAPRLPPVDPGPPRGLPPKTAPASKSPATPARHTSTPATSTTHPTSQPSSSSPGSSPSTLPACSTTTAADPSSSATTASSSDPAPSTESSSGASSPAATCTPAAAAQENADPQSASEAT